MNKEKDLFEDEFMAFMSPPKEIKPAIQKYYDHLSKIIITGSGMLPDPESPEDYIFRELTENEEEELYYLIGSWLNSLN